MTLLRLLLLPQPLRLVLSDRRRVSISSPDLRGSSNPFELHVWHSLSNLFALDPDYIWFFDLFECISLLEYSRHSRMHAVGRGAKKISKS